MKPIPVFVGYDPREAVAYHTCANSIIRHASRPVAIIPLALNLFEDYEETHTDGSNHFIYSRFLVPHLMEYTGHAIFIDGDMIVRDDIVELWEQRDVTKDVQVVKHDYKTRMTEKYLGAPNENYPRKIGVVLFYGIVTVFLTGDSLPTLSNSPQVVSSTASRG